MRRHEPLQAAYDLAVHDAQRMAPKGFTVWLPYPPSLNGNTRNLPKGGRVKTKRYTDWIAAAMLTIRTQRPARIEGHFRASIIVERPDRRVRDVDNLIKPCLDILVMTGAIKADHLCDFVSAGWQSREPVADAGVIITVEPV